MSNSNFLSSFILTTSSFADHKEGIYLQLVVVLSSSWWTRGLHYNKCLLCNFFFRGPNTKRVNYANFKS